MLCACKLRVELFVAALFDVAWDSPQAERAAAGDGFRQGLWVFEDHVHDVAAVAAAVFDVLGFAPGRAAVGCCRVGVDHFDQAEDGAILQVWFQVGVGRAC
ncbi:Uncharacterised protein [Mycobacteroides abscessus]|uniref:Uncharacterized protein n=1 Tax=Mycobacteroides abscessus TaxID=36809 RepID=A0A0U0ZTY5_9MYCO|nr:Uncharacterised protein [Mycobacteroides abscessus]